MAEQKEQKPEIPQSIMAPAGAVEAIANCILELCKFMPASKSIFDLSNTKTLSFEQVLITDITHSPNSFVAELVGTKSYVYYNQSRMKLTYFLSTMEDLEIMKNTTKIMVTMMRAQREKMIKEEEEAHKSTLKHNRTAATK